MTSMFDIVLTQIHVSFSVDLNESEILCSFWLCVWERFSSVSYQSSCYQDDLWQTPCETCSLRSLSLSLPLCLQSVLCYCSHMLINLTQRPLGNRRRQNWEMFDDTRTVRESFVSPFLKRWKLFDCTQKMLNDCMLNTEVCWCFYSCYDRSCTQATSVLHIHVIPGRVEKILHHKGEKEL